MMSRKTPSAHWPNAHSSDVSDDDTAPSRSQQRREALNVLDLAKQAVALTPHQRSLIGLPEDIEDHIKRAASIPSPIARKREVQFVAKQLRKDEDACELLRQTLYQSDEDKARETALHQRLERWRDRLIAAEDNAVLTELMEAHPALDAQRLRQLIRQAQKEAEKNKPPKASRELFKLLREGMAED